MYVLLVHIVDLQIYCFFLVPYFCNNFLKGPSLLDKQSKFVYMILRRVIHRDVSGNESNIYIDNLLLIIL
jgi:hypothetical protein